MKNFKIVLILSVVLISFFAFRAINEGDMSLNIFNFGGTIAPQALGQTIGEFRNENSAEILSQNFISVSPIFLSNIKCADDESLSAHLALVRFLNDNNKVYELNSGSYWPIASITKLITAVVAKENIDLEKKITFEASMILGQNRVENFKTGETYNAADLLEAMMILSSNDAAEALAQDFSRDKFIGLMNQKAQQLNLSSTSFADPTGLSPQNQSTPNDIFKIISYLYQKYPEILKLTTQKRSYITELNLKKRNYISNINEFAGRADFIGGKTGFIEEAKGNLVSLFNVKKEPAVIVILGSQDRFGDTKKLLDCIQSEN